ncbi:MAG: hypothetical protein RJA76_490 [Bacteroidota bacterium]
MKKIQEEYIQNIKSFFSCEIYYEDPEFYGATYSMVTYRQFLDRIIESREYNRIMERIEIEFHQRNDSFKFKKSDFIEGYFIHIFGKPLPLNPENAPNFEAEYSQMMSPGFMSLCLNYLKTGTPHFPLNESEKSKINFSKGKSGCMLFLPVMIIIMLTYFLFLNQNMSTN